MKSALADLQKVQISVIEKVRYCLEQAGEELVQIARNTHTYQDRTGNLTASIGYGVFINGQLVHYGGFEEGLLGGQVGINALKDVVPQGAQYAIAVIAGMDYAEAVNRRGYVVLDNAELSAHEVVTKLLDQIQL